MRNVKITAFIVFFLFIFGLTAGEYCNINAFAAYDPGFDTYSKGYYMVNLDLGTVVAAKNENERCFPASLTKLMTAIVAYESCADLSAPAEVTHDAMDVFDTDDPNINGASVCGLCVGQTGLTIRDCLYGLLVKSGCEAGNVIAYNLGKGDGKARIQEFIDRMNNKAKEIGCLDTHFSNTHGLWEEDNYSTPYDLYLIARYIYDNLPEIMDICDTYEYVMPANSDNPEPYRIYNVNGLVNRSPENKYYYPAARGMKTGSMGDYYTKDANGNYTVKHEGFANLISTASQNGVSYMLVCCEAPFHDVDGTRLYGHYKDSPALYNWAFVNFGITKIVDRNTAVTQINVVSGKTDSVSLVPSEEFSMLLPENSGADMIHQNITITAEKDENGAVFAPVEKGQVIGRLELVKDGETIWETGLTAQESVEKYIPETVTTDVPETVSDESHDENENGKDAKTNDPTAIIIIMSVVAGLSVSSVCVVAVMYNKKKKK